MDRYVFTGVVHPERASLTFDMRPMRVEFTDGTSAVLRLGVTAAGGRVKRHAPPLLDATEP
jgi:hypothetical protein